MANSIQSRPRAGRRPNRKKRQSNLQKKKPVLYIVRTLVVLLTTILWLFIVVFFSCVIITHGPSEKGKSIFVTTLLESGQMKFLVRWFLSEEEISSIVNNNSMQYMDDSVDSQLIDTASDITVEELNQVTIEEVSGDNFSGTMMIVRDPARVFVGTTYPWSEYGITLDALVDKYHAYAGVNGGLYESVGNRGGQPIGPVVSEGEIQNINTNNLQGVVLIGLSEDNILKIIDIDGMDEETLRKSIADEKIRDAVCFQEEASDSSNHFVKLIVNGQAREMNGMGSGANPRTVIGQTADGTILLLVTDGRGANGHLGATASDLISIMLKYGAVNAANLDGGSSSSMYADGTWYRSSVTFYYANSSWNIPDGFLIRRTEDGI